MFTNLVNPKAVFAGYFLLAMHYFLPNMGGYGLYLPYNVIGWMLITTLIGIGFWEISRTGFIKLSKTQIFGWIGFLFFLLPLIYPNNEFAGLAYFRIFGLLGGLAFYSALLQFRFQKMERLFLLYIMLSAVVIQSLLGLVQYLGLFSDSYFLLNKKLLPYGSFQHKNVMTTFMATGIGISLFLVGDDPEIEVSKLKKLLVFLIPFTGSIIIIAIKSKAGYLGLFFILLLMLPSIKLKEKFYQRWLIVLLTGIVIGWFTPNIYQSLKSRELPKKGLNRQNEIRTKKSSKTKLYTRDMDSQLETVSSRMAIYETTFRIWKDNPLIGVGYGRFTRVCREYLAARRAHEAEFDYVMDEYFDHPHNEILLWISEGGIAPLIGILLFTVTYLIMVFQIHWKKSLTYLGLVFPILLHTQFEFPFYTSLAHWIVFLTLIYVPDEKDNIQYRYGVHRAMILPAVVVPLMTYYYMGRTLKNIEILTRFENTGYNNYSLLQQIKDPGPLHLKYDNYILKATMEVGLKTKNIQTLKMFLNNAEQFIHHAPLLHIYNGMVRALLALGREDDAASMVERARYLYPDTKDAWLQLDNQK